VFCVKVEEAATFAFAALDAFSLQQTSEHLGVAVAVTWKSGPALIRRASVDCKTPTPIFLKSGELKQGTPNVGT
jgi:hypothetical protein